MHEYGLIGHPLSHSYSKRYFETKFRTENLRDHAYDLFDLPQIGDFKELLKRRPNLLGVNVTLPYKIAILPYLSRLSPDALSTGAVNTIQIREGECIGHNTDVYGFERSLLPLIDVGSTHALVFGNGGAARAVMHVLRSQRIPFQLVSRSGYPMGYRDVNADVIRSCNLLINTTPLGMYPDTDTCLPLPFNLLDNRHLVYDLVYNPEMTLLLKRASEKGCRIKNGLEMLYLQAEKSWDIWNDGT